MTFIDLLNACAYGSLPKVKYNNADGAVTTIKDNGKYKGCGVSFPGIYGEVWFWDSPETDKRSRYMRDLTLKT